MNLLLDTHVLLWSIADDPRLSADTLREMADKRNRLVVSVISSWEITIKAQKGRLRIPDDLRAQIRATKAEILPVTLDHTLAVGDLPALHGDPFDRLLIAQARTEGLTLVTSDTQISRYDVAVLPA